MHIADIQTYAASIGHNLTEQNAGMVAALVGLAPQRPTVEDLNAWIARHAA